MTDSPPLLRAARPDEAEAISALALRSKRLWGYDEGFMRRMTPVMRITAADIEAGHVEALEDDGRLIAFFRLKWPEGHAWLEDLFVDPESIGHGHGRRLFERALQVSREHGDTAMRFESDPHAEAFYLRLGAVKIGMSPNDAIPGRSVPLMEYRLDAPAGGEP